jgi:phage terminase small subunit
MSKELTPKQQRFCDEYLKDLNGTQAAIRAGYSENTAKEIASENLTKPNIQEYLNSKRIKLEKKTEITQEWVLKKLKRIYIDANQVKEFAPANKALELLGKHLGMFADRVKLSGDKDGDPIKVENKLTLDAINERIVQMLDK